VTRPAAATRALPVLLCAAPLVARLLLPNVAPNDGFYGHAAFMLARGATPYHDFTQVAFPLAEGALALAIRLFGHDLRTIELANALMIGAVALALHRAGRALAGPRAGAVAAIAWCWSLWVVHFNLFERETWAALGVALAFGAYARGFDAAPLTDSTADRRTASRAATAVAAGQLLAVLVKLTALFAAAGLALHLVVTGRARAALALTARLAALLLLATLLGWALWGQDFLVQVWLFGFFRSATGLAPTEKLVQLVHWADPLTVLGLAALLAVGLPAVRRAAGAPALVLLCQLAYALLLSPTLWEHNLIELAPACALLLGATVAQWPRGRLAFAAATGALVVVIATLGRPWLAGDYGPWGAGFGGWPRDAITRRGEFLERHSGPDELVVTSNPWWSLQAGRVEAVRYFELQPVVDGLEASLQADGLLATLAKRTGPLLLGPGFPPADPRAASRTPFVGRLVANALAYTRPALLDALSRHEIALLLEPLPLKVLLPADLQAAGYERFEDLELGLAAWRPRAAGTPFPPAAPR
jgi:hypothetical protein